MPKIALYFFLFISFFSLAQDFDNQDKKVRSYPVFTSIDHLAYRIKNDFATDMQRVRAAFVWLTHNITYGKTMDELFRPKPTIIYYSESGREQALKKVQNEKVNYTFENKRGVCFDYSMLLKKLCDRFGLESEIVWGISKAEIRDVSGEKLYKNHAWNVVKIDNEWRLMDPTWATGYWDASNKVYIRAFNEHYFNTNPKKFIKDHFPAEMKWQLLEVPLALNDFYTAPIFLPRYFESEVILSNQTTGLLAQSENLELVLAFEKFPPSTQLNYSIDSSGTTGKIRNADVKKKGNKLYISKLKLKGAIQKGQKLTLYIDKSPILKFRINQ